MWIDEFDKLFFSNDNSYENTIKAIQLKYDNMPDYFYKYCKADVNTLNSLKNNNLYFSSISTFNDTFECAMAFPKNKIIKMICKEIIKLIKNRIDPNFDIQIDDIITLENFILKIDKLKKIPKNILNENIKITIDAVHDLQIDITTSLYLLSDDIYRICCFSTIKDSLTMWSYYADSNQGFCIEYNFKELKNDFTELLLPVRYTNEILDISDCFTGKINDSIMLNALTRKYTEYSKEKEWRIIVKSTNNFKNQFETISKPKKIILGNKIDQENKNNIIEIAKEQNIEIYQMKKRNDSYELYPVKLEI